MKRARLSSSGTYPSGVDEAPEQLVLASASPRRQELFARLGIAFTVRPAEVEEGTCDTRPEAVVTELAARKAAAVAGELDHGLVVGADTIVVLDGRILGKPQDEADARAMLEALAGRVHQVYSGVAVCAAASMRLKTAWECTKVRMRRLHPREIQAYVVSGEPLDKAGSYGIQGLGSLLVESIEGCYFNVVGLPLGKLNSLLREFGYDMLENTLLRPDKVR